MSTTVNLTLEQKRNIFESLGIACDQLVLSYIPDDIDLETTLKDPNSSILLALSQTYTVS